MIQKRESMYLNIVKGIAILLMLWGHAIQICIKDDSITFENNVFQFIYSFHMPLFMLLSGYLFFFSYKKRDLKTLLAHRTQSMLQPIFFATILNNLLILLPTLILHGQGRLINGALLNGLYTLWFLWCVLSASTVVAVAGKMTSNSWARLLLMLAGFFLVALFPEWDYHVYMYPYFVVGFYYGMYRDKIPDWVKKCAWLSLVLFPILVSKYETYHLIYLSPIYYDGADVLTCVKVNVFRWIIGFVGSLFALVVIDFVLKLFYREDKTPAPLGMLAKLGENSLAIYCISVSLFTYYLSKFYDRFVRLLDGSILIDNMTIYNFVFTPALALAAAWGLYIVVQILKKLKIHRLIFGR